MGVEQSGSDSVSMFPGSLEVSGFGAAAGVAFNFFVSPEEWFR